MNDDFNLDALKMKKKKRINSRTKGNTFERQVADIFNTFFNTHEFQRTPGSGAFATTHKLPDHLMVWGDLIIPKQFKFIFEIKKGYNTEGICKLWGKSKILDFVTKIEMESKKANKSWMLIFKQDRETCLVIKRYNTNLFKYPERKLLFTGLKDIDVLVMCSLSELLMLNKPDLHNPWF